MTTQVDAALAALWNRADRLPEEPGAVALLNEDAALRLFRMRWRLRRRNGWPGWEKVCGCGRLYAGEPRVRKCPECR